jgi:hypothetical protein
MSFAHPWRLSPSAFANITLFHGSCEPWHEPVPRPGGYDNVFWTAEDPLTAQIYIPTWYGMTIFGFSKYRLGEQVTPDQQSFAWDLAQQLGAKATVHKADFAGRAQSWTYSGRTVTYADIKQFLNELGYASQDAGEEHFRVKTVYMDTPDGLYRPQAVRADTFPLGRLIMLPRPPDLSADLRKGDEPDLTDLDYHQVNSFRQAFSAGHKSITINDFCQSPRMGNVGHTSIGLSGEVLAELHQGGLIRIIAATHRDYGAGMGQGPDGYLTPDFLDWHFGETAQALALGYPVPADVVAAHRTRFECALSDRPGESPFLISTSLDSLHLDSVLSDSSETCAQAVAEIVKAIKFGMPEVSATFTVDAYGHLICRGGVNLIEAVRQTGSSIPITAQITDLQGRVVSCAAMHSALMALDRPVDLESDPFTPFHP